jgi:hypothetical protein
VVSIQQEAKKVADAVIETTLNVNDSCDSLRPDGKVMGQFRSRWAFTWWRPLALGQEASIGSGTTHS